MEELTINDLPESVFPKEPDKDDLCLVCKIVKRRRHSWFCRKECEDVFVREHSNG